MHNSTHWGIYEYSSDYDTVAMNDQADKYADARHSDEVDHLAVLVMRVLMKLKEIIVEMIKRIIMWLHR